MLSANRRSRPHPATGWAVRRLRELADPLALALAAARCAGGPAAPIGPLPPRRLRARTGAPGIREFSDSGHRAAQELAGVLAAGGLPPLRSYASVLDFGCGSARVLPHMRALAPAARCAGCDVDPAAIAWAAAHHRGLEFTRSGFAPPLAFPAASFELVYSISVFSHIDEPLEDLWLRELERVLAPGGVALLSVHGAHAFEQFRVGAARTGWCDPAAFTGGPLDPGELRFVPYVRTLWNEGELPGVGADYGLAFHGPDYLRSRWAEVFDVVEIAPRALAGWQDVVACRKP